MKGFILVLLASTSLASAQVRQPGQMTTLPTTTPQEFDVLGASGIWAKLGVIDPASNLLLPNSASGMDVRAAGCKADGSDQTACIQNALNNAPTCVMIPATTSGFSINGTINVTKCLRGVIFRPSRSPLGFAGSSFLNCNNQTAQPCVTVNNSDVYATQLENFTVTGSGATPVVGSIGLQWKGGYNLLLNNVQFENFGTCAYFGPTAAAGTNPISMHSINTFVGRCLQHYIVNDGIPELYFTGGRWGGANDYNSADDFVYSTRTTGSGAGGGPNSLIIDTIQINPGGRSVGCAFRWGGFTSTTGGFNANKIVNSHIEVLGNSYTGSASRGMFCVDSTVPYFPGMYVANSGFFEDTTPKVMPFFNIDPAVKTEYNGSRSEFIGNDFNCCSTLNFNANQQLFYQGINFSNNFVFAPATFTGGDTSALAQITSNNFWQGYTIAGSWQSLNISNNIGTLTDTASGNVFAAGDPLTRAWTPTLTFNHASVGVTYGNQYGSTQRRADGGHVATGVIVLTSKGTSTGTARIENVPYGCASGVATVPSGLTGMTGLTGALRLQAATGAGNNYATFVQSSPTGDLPISDTNFTNTSTIVFSINCARTL